MTTTIDGKILLVRGGGLHESFHVVGNQATVFENEEYVKKLDIIGGVRKWKLPCYENNVALADSIVLYLQEKMRTKSSVALVVDEGDMHQLDTTVYPLNVGLRYDSAKKTLRNFNVEFQEKLFSPQLGSLRLCLPFEEGVGDVTRDTSGYNNDGVIHGASWVDGKFGKALNYDGNDYINCGHDPSFNITTAIALKAWVKFATNYSSGSPRMDVMAKRACYLLRFSDISGRLLFELYDGSWHTAASSKTSWTADVWYRIIGTWNGTQMKLYVDGVELGSTDWSGTISTSGYDVLIGNYGIGYAFYFIGTMDENDIDSQVPSLEEIKLDYLSGVILHGRSLNARGLVEDSKAVVTQQDRWENERYRKQPSFYGVTRTWPLNCYEKNVPWSSSVARDYERIAAEGNPVSFVVDEGDLHQVCTKAGILNVDIHYPKGAKPSSFVRYFTVKLQEAPS